MTHSPEAPPPEVPAPRPRSVRATTILGAARKLILQQGFKAVTMAAIADHAHVGKGTAYQYWHTKEELFLELVADDLVEVLAQLAARVLADPADAYPDVLCVAVARAWLERPLIGALESSNGLVLGGLLNQPGALDLRRNHSPHAILQDLIPIWRAYRVVRTDWSAQQQSDALALLAIGFFTLAAGSLEPNPAQFPTLELAIQGLLQRRESGPDDRVKMAAEVSAVLDAHAQTVHAAIAQPERRQRLRTLHRAPMD